MSDTEPSKPLLLEICDLRDRLKADLAAVERTLQIAMELQKDESRVDLPEKEHKP